LALDTHRRIILYALLSRFWFIGEFPFSMKIFLSGDFCVLVLPFERLTYNSFAFFRVAPGRASLK
jgi:hypothetical protein